MTFRDDIQVLRALAVIMVVLYHLKVPGFASGFLGVDLFFVISGFLMEKLYDPAKGALAFYERRARRLLPAYYATILATLLAAFVITLPPEFVQIAEQSVYAAFFASNIGFWTHEGYFNKFDFSPLLHLWSLGVELQFYLLLPLIFWFRRRLGDWMLPALIVASLMLCAGLMMVNPKTAFLMMPTRIWEFGFGMLAARWGGAVPRDRRIALLATIGLCTLMVVPVVGDTRDLVGGHPGVAALSMCVCTALALWGGLPQALCITPLKKLGDWSYSIYLAHFPVIVLMNYRPFTGTNLGGLYSLPIIALAAFLLYRYFERGRLYTARRAGWASAGLALLGLVAVPAQAVRFDQADHRIFGALTDRAAFRCGKLFKILHPGDSLCTLSEGPKGTVLLIGDSRADTIKMALVDVARARGYGVRFALSNEPLIEAGYGPEWLAAEARSAKALFYHYTPGNYAKTKRPDLPIPTALIPFTPEFHASVPEALYRYRHEGIALPQTQSATYPPYCATDCPLTHDGKPLYFDKHHLTLTGAERIKPVLEKIFQETVP